MRKLFEIRELRDGRLRFDTVDDMDEVAEALFTYGCQSDGTFSAVVTAALALLSDVPGDTLVEMAREFRRERQNITAS